MIPVAIQEQAVERRRLPVTGKVVRQLGQAPRAMGMAASATGRLPHVLLGIALRRGHMQPQERQARMRRTEGPNGWPTMPRGAIPPQHDRHLGRRVPELLARLRRGDGIPLGGLHDYSLARAEMQDPVATPLLAPRVDRHDGRLTAHGPHCGRGRWQRQRGFILCPQQRRGSVLGAVESFFSSAASQAATACAEREVSTGAGR